MKYAKWSRDELRRLEQIYATSSNEALQAEFAPRSLSTG